MERGPAVADSEVFLLLEEYCSKRQRSWRRSVWEAQLMSGQRPRHTGHAADPKLHAPSIFSTYVGDGWRNMAATGHAKEKHNVSPARSGSTAVDRLVQITETAPVPEADMENQDDIIQKLVTLMIMLGDDIEEKIKQNSVVQQQLSSLNYDTFKALTSSVQSLVGQGGAAAASEEQVQWQNIALAFEVTSRLSATGVVQRRRVLSFGERYIRQHHSAWVQQHGGWKEAFAVD